MKSKLPNIETTIFAEMSALAHQHNAINLSQGFPNFSSAPILFDRVKFYMENGYNQYAPLSGVEKLRSTITRKIERLYAKKLNVHLNVCVTAGATQAIYTAIQSLIFPDDEAIIFEPAFDIYEPAIELAGGKTIRITTTYPEFKIDWEQVNQNISSKTKLIVLNSPNNPSGKILNPSDILALESLTEKFPQLYIISDEVYEHMVFNNQPHLSILKSEILFKKSFIAFSFGKTFHNTGWKVGYVIAPEALMKEFKKLHQFIVFSVNKPVQYALSDYLEDDIHYINLSNDYQKRRDYFLDQIAKSRFKYIPTNGTYYQLLDYSEISQLDDKNFAVELTKKYGVATIPLSSFYKKMNDQKLLRVCFAKTEDVLKSAGEKLCEI